MHVQRLATLLVSIANVIVINPYQSVSSSSGQLVVGCGPPGVLSILRMASALRNEHSDIVHIHVSGMNRFAYGGHLLVSLLPRAVRRILTIHSGSFVPDFRRAGWLTRKLIALLVRRFDLLVAVSAEIEAQLIECGVRADAIAVLPAFIPPDDYPAGTGLADQADSADGHRKLLVTSGYGIRDYGFDVLIKALLNHGQLGTDCTLALCLYNTYDETYVSELEQLLAKLPHARIYRDLTPAAFSKMLSGADIYVRATTRDGDAVAIREAAHYKKAIVASDCVVRPPGCQVFRTGDPDALADALTAVMSDPQAGRVRGDEDVRARYLSLYRRVISKR
ncbi:MAG: glycosyltransferase family 4 protein [Gammaproteobacteria bacterium]|nr:glycosyltransferase family 4 protein [Gammaproteobacteria bacterium]